MTERQKYSPSLSYATTRQGPVITLVGVPPDAAWEELKGAILGYCHDCKFAYEVRDEGLQVNVFTHAEVDGTIRPLVHAYMAKVVGIQLFRVHIIADQ